MEEVIRVFGLMRGNFPPYPTWITGVSSRLQIHLVCIVVYILLNSQVYGQSSRYFGVPLWRQMKCIGLALNCIVLQVLLRKTKQACGISDIVLHGSPGSNALTKQGTSKFNPTWRDFNLQNGWSFCHFTCFLHLSMSFKSLKHFPLS